MVGLGTEPSRARAVLEGGVPQFLICGQPYTQSSPCSHLGEPQLHAPRRAEHGPLFETLGPTAAEGLPQTLPQVPHSSVSHPHRTENVQRPLESQGTRFMVTSLEKEQVKLQGKVGRWFAEHWVLACPHLEAETTRAPTSRPSAPAVAPGRWSASHCSLVTLLYK